MYTLDEVKQISLANEVPIIFDDTKNILTDTVKKLQPKHILEIGGGTGYSAMVMLSANKTITIQKATSNDINIAFDMLRDAATWLKNNNIDYWQNWHNPPKEHIQWIKDGFDNGEFYFVYDDKDEIMGMYRLSFRDEMFWGRQKDKAGYIHSLTTKRTLKGKGIGGLILTHIEKELAQKGFDYLRLDCGDNIKKLCEYYEKHGFKPKETVFINDAKLRLYEKRLGNPLPRLISIEKNEDRHKHLQKVLTQFGCTAICGDAGEILPTLNDNFDFVFLDGPKAQYGRYFDYIDKLLVNGGTIFADNMNFHGMVDGSNPTTKGAKTIVAGLKSFVEKLENKNYQIKKLPDGDGIIIATKGSTDEK